MSDSPDYRCEAGGNLILRVALAEAEGSVRYRSRAEPRLRLLGAFLKPWVADANGDGNADLVFRSYASGSDSGLVQEVVSDGAGGFSVGPLRVLPGRGWNDLFDAFRAVDLTGDGDDEFIWLDETLTSSRVAVTGDLPDTTTTTSSTTTTLPNPSDCVAIPGVPGLQCSCAVGLTTGTCAGASMPAKIANGFGKACASIDRAAAGDGKPSKLLKKAGGRLRKITKAAGKRGVQSSLPAGCGESLQTFLTASAIARSRCGARSERRFRTVERSGRMTHSIG